MLFNVVSNLFISSVFLVFPHEKSKATYSENPKHLEISLQKNFCKANTSHPNQSNSCPAKVFKEADILKLQEESFAKGEAVQNDRSFQDFQTNVLKKNDKIVNSKSFQAAVTELKENSKKTTETSKTKSPGELYIFVSFSLGEKALLNLARDAKQFDATLVLRGFKDGSYTKTAKAFQKIIQKTGQGVIIDPEFFELFAVRAVPNFILTKPLQLYAEERLQTPLHDRIQGHISARYALETFSRMGELKYEALALLQQKESK